MSVLKDGVIYTFGEIFAKSIPFILIPYLSSKVGVDGYGKLAVMQSYVVLVHVFVGLSQNAAVARYYFRYGYRGLRSLIFKSYVISLAFVSPVLLYALIQQSIEWLLVGGCAFLQIHFLIQLSINQSRRLAGRYVALQFMFNFLLLINCILYFEFIGNNYLGYFVATMLAYLIVLSFINITGISFRGKSVNIRGSSIHYCYLLSFGGGLIFHQLALFGKSFFDRIILSQNFSDAEVGLYSIGYQLASIIQVLLVALNTAIVPYYYKAIKEGELDRVQVIKYFKFALLLVPVVASITFMTPGFIFEMVFGFRDVDSYFFLFSIAISLNASYFVLTNFYFYYSRTMFISKVNTVSVVVHVFLVLWFGSISIELVPYALILSNLLLVFGLLYRFNRWQID